MPLVKLIGWLSLWSGRAGAILVLPLVLAMVYEVVSRYFFAAPTQWAFELSYMMMGTIFLLGLSYALLVDQHVNVDFIHQKLPKRGVALIDAIGYAVLAGMLLWLTQALIGNAMSVYRTGEGSGLSAWNPKIWPYRTIYVIGFALFGLQSAARAAENLMIVALGATDAERAP
ncbi:TRAP transporter small permease subunit [Bosea sp. (in: a-proteobacteria)]|uniref:TRAP transporter small permease subunit n=1 Tax=Bosea sp. (in: a-proteobacteria) TaxID=1871050 RepID=UPI001AC51C0B|nr:TRAP transporter small permease subunit [Bosea sp. (in: a-proteobacteria)]MBN9443188.1 TRAP transporter small permease subunit [Bosea sp. (in: a-proteobacteria)]